MALREAEAELDRIDAQLQFRERDRRAAAARSREENEATLRLEVTERGKPVAMLGPVDESGSALRELVASGRATPPQGDLLDLAPPRGPISSRGSRTLHELRGERL